MIFPAVLGLFAGFHLVLSDGHNQLQGQAKHVAKEVVRIFRNMGIDVTWSTDPSDQPPSSRSVVVAILPHSSRDWHIGDEVMATVARNAPGSQGSVFVFFPDVARTIRHQPARSGSIQNGRPPGVGWHVGVARVVAHEILHYFLPRKPHDQNGIFSENLRGDTLLNPQLDVTEETSEALRAMLR